MTGFEDFFALPIGAQIGIVAFGIAIVLLAIAQVLTVASHRAKDHAASFEALRAEIKGLSSDDRSSGLGTRGSAHGLAPPPRPVKAARVRKNGTSTSQTVSSAARRRG